MQVGTDKLQLLTAAAILVLVSGGIAAYAQNQNVQSSSSTTSTASASQSSSSTSSTSIGSATATTANTPLCTPPAVAGEVGRLVLPITQSQSQTGTILFAGSRGCTASITTIGGVFSVHVALRYAKSLTQYNVFLVANGTSYTLGNMVTGRDGSGQMMNQVLLKTGTYTVSIQIFDTSTIPGQSTLVMQSAQGTIVSAPFPTANPNGHSTQPYRGENDSDK